MTVLPMDMTHPDPIGQLFARRVYLSKTWRVAIAHITLNGASIRSRLQVGGCDLP